MNAISHEGVAAWVADRAQSGLSASTIRQPHRVFTLLLGLAVSDGRLARNPAIGVPLPRAARGEQMHLSHSEVDDLAREAGDYRMVIYQMTGVSGTTGL